MQMQMHLGICSRLRNDPEAAAICMPQLLKPRISLIIQSKTLDTRPLLLSDIPELSCEADDCSQLKLSHADTSLVG